MTSDKDHILVALPETTALLDNGRTRHTRKLSGSTSSQEDTENAPKELKTLAIACALTTFFFFVELIGGYIAGSLAIMSDAAHLLSDLAGLLISLVAVSVARIPASAFMSFGFARAEVLGAFVSLIFIWSLTIVLVFMAIHRLFSPSDVNGPLMLLLGAIGLAVNIVLGLVLGHGHGHGHGHDHNHNHAQSHGNGEHDERRHAKEDGDHELRHDEHGGHNHDHGAQEKPSLWDWRKWMFGQSIASVNVRAAYLHVLGDALQNVGVLVAAAIITIFPSFTIVDPICTLFFAVVVVFTTKNLARETMVVLMEGAPPGVSLEKIHDELKSIDGVLRVGDFHVWSITSRRPALSVHLYKTPEASDHDVLKRSQHILKNKFNISHATIQINCKEPRCCDDDVSANKDTESCLTASNLEAPF